MTPTLEQRILALLDEGKSHEDILGQFVGAEVEEAQELLDILTMLSSIDVPAPSEDILKRAIADASTPVAEVAQKETTSRVGAFFQALFMSRFIAYGAVGACVVIFAIGVVGYMNYGAPSRTQFATNTFEDITVEGSILSAEDMFFEDMETLDELFADDVDVESGLLALATLDLDTPTSESSEETTVSVGATAELEDLTTELNETLDALEADFSDLESFELELDSVDLDLDALS